LKHLAGQQFCLPIALNWHRFAIQCQLPPHTRCQVSGNPGAFNPFRRTRHGPIRLHCCRGKVGLQRTEPKKLIQRPERSIVAWVALIRQSALDLALGLRLHRGAAHMAHQICFDIFGRFVRYVAGPVVAEKRRIVQRLGAVAAGGSERRSSVSVTFLARMLVHSLWAMMSQEKSSSTVDRYISRSR